MSAAGVPDIRMRVVNLPPLPRRTHVDLHDAKRMKLTPIPWGKPDPLLGKLVCRHFVQANAPIVVPFNPRFDAKVRKELRVLGVDHY